MKNLKRNKDGTLEGILTMGDLIGSETDADTEETGTPPPNVPPGVQALIRKINKMIKVRYIGEDNPLALRTGKVYDAMVLKKGWLGIVDETKEEYAYPPELLEIVDT